MDAGPQELSSDPPRRMPHTVEYNTSAGTARLPGGRPAASQGLEWLWQRLRDLQRPKVLDCGPVSPATLQILLQRDAKFYAADLITPLFNSDPKLWDHSGKIPVFLVKEFLNRLPTISEGSLEAIFCWNLFDLAPHDTLPEIAARFFALLQPLGALFCILREPQHPAGVERKWWLETLTSYANESDAKKSFSYPPVTNREMERLAAGASLKTFLTRSGRREILAVRPAPSA
ncbi:MAG: hypothetical protein ACRD22_04515 [Terriglobia bacterium]